MNPLVGLSVVFLLAANGPVTIARIESDWTRRQLSIEQLEVTWDESRFISRGGISSLSALNKEPTIPPDDVVYPVTDNYLALGREGRIRRRTRMVDSSAFGTNNPRTLPILTSGFDGSLAKDLVESDYEYPRGVLFGPQYPDYSVAPLKPLLLWCRPLATDGARLSLLNTRIVSSSDVTIGNTVITGSRRKSSHWQMWIDQSHDSVPTKYEEYVNGKVRFIAEMSYDNTFGDWLPAKWRTMFVSPAGDVLQSCDSTVRSVRVNHQLPDGHFRIEYPSGTWVVDRTDNREWIELAGGKKRMITPRELMDGVSYDDLVRGNGSPLRWAFQGVMVVVVAVIALVVFKYMRNRHA